MINCPLEVSVGLSLSLYLPVVFFLTEPIPRSCVPLYVFMLQLSALFVLCASYESAAPSPLQTSLGCSWVVLQDSPSSGCRAQIAPQRLCFRRGGGVNAPGMLPHRKDGPLQAHLECRLNILPLPSPASTHRDTTCGHAHPELTLLPLEIAGTIF